MYVFAGCSLPLFFLPSFLPLFFPSFLSSPCCFLFSTSSCTFNLLAIEKTECIVFFFSEFKNLISLIWRWDYLEGSFSFCFQTSWGDLYIMRKMETKRSVLCAARKCSTNSSACCFYLICPLGPLNRFYDFSNVGISIEFVTLFLKNAYKVNTFAVRPASGTCHL